MSNQNNQEKIETLREAQELLLQALELIKEVGLDTFAYRSVVQTLEIIASKDHDWLTEAANIDDLIESLSDEDDEEEYED